MDLENADIDDLSKSVTSAYFDTVLVGTQLSFRITSEVRGVSVVRSNIQTITWAYNAFAVVETMRIENAECGFSELEFDIIGSGSADLLFNLSGDANSYAKVFDKVSGLQIMQFTDVGTQTLSVTVSGTKSYRVELYNTDIVDYGGTSVFVSCRRFSMDETPFNLFATMGVDVADSGDTYNISLLLDSVATKYANVSIV